MINVPAKLSLTGKRERNYYRTRDLANAASKVLKETRETFGNQAAAISPMLAEMAVAAQNLLDPFGVTILEAAQTMAEEKRKALRSAITETALAEFIAKKEGLSEKQISAYGYMGRDMREAFSGRNLSTLTEKELSDHLEKYTSGPGSYNQRLRLISAFWNWCAKAPRNWCAASAIDHLESKETVSSEIRTLNASQARKLLSTAEMHYPETVPAFAIALFTGMRKEEIKRLQPEDFTDDGISVPASSAKTRRRRFIQMPAPLAAWLKIYPIEETVCPSNWERKEKAVRRLAGWKIWSDLVEPVKPSDSLPEWPNNALRHTAATVALALGKPLETLVFEHGHSGGLSTLRNHYIGQMPKKEAVAIWTLGPKGRKLSYLKVV